MKIADSCPLNAGMTIEYPEKKVTFAYPDAEIRHNKLLWINEIVWAPLKYIYVISAIYSMMGVGALDILFSHIVTEKIFIFYVAILLIGYALSYVLAAYIGFNYEKFKFWFPKFNHEIRMKTDGYNKCEVKNLKSKTFEIPLFFNAILDYSLIGDYAEQIKKIEIIPHDFKYCQLNKHDEIDDSLWRALFTFRKIPKSGYMWVYFT